VTDTSTVPPPTPAAVEHLDELQRRFSELERQRSDLQDRQLTLGGARSDLQARSAAASDVDDLRKLREQLAELDLEAHAIENRLPGVQGQLARLRVDLERARQAVNRYRVAALIVETDAVFGRVLAELDEIAALRQAAVAAGAPALLLSPPPGAGVPDRHSDVVAFVLADRLAAHLRGSWASTIVPEAQKDLA